MDINKVVNETYKSSATAMLDEQFRSPELDYALRQIQALEKIAQNMEDRIKVAEDELKTHKKALDVYEEALQKAENDVSKTRVLAILSLLASIAAVIVPVILR